MPRILFQLHPHPTSVRAILKAELERYPECAESLNKEWELALPEKDFLRLVEEPAMAQRLIVASSFTRETLIAHGLNARHIHVIPYGIDGAQYSSAPTTSRSANPSGPLEVLFVGRLTQRKGIRYLLESLDCLNSRQIHLTVCGWVVDDLALLKQYRDRITVKASATSEEIQRAYERADIFVLPSVAEGFGYVLLEAMASGVPIIGTTRTAAPDLISEGQEGFIIEPSSVAALAESLDWAASHRAQVREMGHAARERVSHFSWKRFRHSVVASVQQLSREILEEQKPTTSGQYV